jgi:Bacterial nucleoid DNA-binding protein
MNKAELATKIAATTGTSNLKAVEAINTVFEAIAEGLSKGEPIVIANFGKFFTNRTSARMRYNPATGQNMDAAPKTVVRFKPGKGLKAMVN